MIEVELVGGPHDGNVIAVREGVREIVFAVLGNGARITEGRDAQSVPVTQVIVPIQYQGNGKAFAVWPKGKS